GEALIPIGGRARVAPQVGARSQGQAREIRTGSDSPEGARRGGWLGRREGAIRSVARCLCAARVRIRARPRTTPDAPYRPAPLHSASKLGMARRGIAAGVAIGWLSAPRRGDWLRNQIRQKFIHWNKVGQRTFYKRRRDLANRVRGSVAGIREAYALHDPYVDANTLVDQVHSQLGREFAPTLEHINLNAVGHTLVLHGYIADELERDRLVSAIAAIEGVGEVDASRLRLHLPHVPELHPEPETAPDVQESSAPAIATPRIRRPRAPR